MNRQTLLAALLVASLLGIGIWLVMLPPSGILFADQEKEGTGQSSEGVAQGAAKESAKAVVETSRTLVQVATAGVASSPTIQWAQATLVSRHDVQISAELAGRLSQVAEVGDTVKVGDAIARLDDEALQLDLRAEEADIKRLEARVHYLAKQLERFEALAGEQIAARHQLDDVVAQRAMAEQDLERARVVRDRTLYALDRSTVKAPFDGLVVERLVAPGGFVSRGDAVARLVDVDRVEVKAQAPLEVSRLVKEGLKVTVEGYGEQVSGRVRAAVPVGDERSRSFEFRVLLSEVPWAVGSALKVSLPSEDPSGPQGGGAGVAIPRDALVLRQGETWVWLVEEGVVRRVDVIAGTGGGDWIWVEGKVSAGDQVVVRGGERLKPGQPVRF